MHFVINKIYKDMNKEQISFDDWMNDYYEH